MSGFARAESYLARVPEEVRNALNSAAWTMSGRTGSRYADCVSVMVQCYERGDSLDEIVAHDRRMR